MATVGTSMLRSTLRMALFVTVALLAAVAGAADHHGGGRGSEIEFGIWVQDPAGGEPRFVPTNEVPYVEEQAFGWRVRNATPGRTIKWVEKVHLPAAPHSWEGVEDSPNITISADGRTATTMGTSLPGDRYVANVWFVSVGDPMGVYEVTVELESGRKASFRFRMVMPKDGRKPALAGEVV